MRSRLPWLVCGCVFLVWIGSLGSCSSDNSGGDFTPKTDAAPEGSVSVDASKEGGSGGSGGGILEATAEPCKPYKCTEDHRTVVDCNGALVRGCEFTEQCAGEECLPACEAAKVLKSSVGCEYFPVAMGAANWTQAFRGCYAVFLANTWTKPVQISVERKGASLDPATFAYLPTGTGANMNYEPLDTAKGLEPGKVAILFLSGPPNPPIPNTVSVDCPAGVSAATVATTGTQVEGTGIGDAFHITTDYPVVAYQMLPYGGGSAGVAGASLLLPTSAWDTNYVAVNAYTKSVGSTAPSNPSLNLVAMEDGTEVKLLPTAAIEGGGSIAATAANTVLTLTLNRGQFAQISQPAELTGSPIESSKPVGLLAGHECMFLPANVKYCDHAEQQIPPVKALGSEYVAVPYRPRTGIPEDVPWRIVGGADGTNLEFDPTTAHAAKTIQRGEVLEFTSQAPFVVKSQDAEHPFILAGYMTGSQKVSDGYGDPDFVRMVPPKQYLQRYVFFTDPTYPETNLVMVRVQGDKGFADVKLDCPGPSLDWQPIGSSGQYEYARMDLVRHNFESQNGCDNGSHELSSSIPFGLFVWGWGTPETGQSPMTQNVSYGYAAGENVVQLNNVIVQTIPK